MSRTALLTGAAGGIGSTIARTLVELGWQIALLDVNEQRLQAMTTTLQADADAGKLLPLAIDLTDTEACNNAVDQTTEAFGGLDMVVNNAGVGMGSIRPDYHLNPISSLEDATVEVWQRFVAVNATAPYLFARAAMPHMRQAGWGRIVNVTTSLSSMLRKGFFPYGPSKAALESMSAIWAEELAGSGITVNVLTPGGPTDTNMVTRESAPDRSILLAPSVMARPLRFLASEESDGFNGRRIIAAHWDDDMATRQAAEAAGGPIGWPGVGAPAIWPEFDGKDGNTP
jgi:NAD(P)-dependent dehydrogenase (short-subunit alcohol dehydrogenase family)